MMTSLDLDCEIYYVRKSISQIGYGGCLGWLTNVSPEQGTAVPDVKVP